MNNFDRRTSNNYSFLVPQYAFDCADLQMQYPRIPSGKYTVYDCTCPEPKLCKTTVICDMETLGGGWTVGF